MKYIIAALLAASVAIAGAGGASAKAPVAKCRGQVAPTLAPGLRVHNLTYICVHGRNGGWVVVPDSGGGNDPRGGTPITEHPL